MDPTAWEALYRHIWHALKMQGISVPRCRDVHNFCRDVHKKIFAVVFTNYCRDVLKLLP